MFHVEHTIRPSGLFGTCIPAQRSPNADSTANLPLLLIGVSIAQIDRCSRISLKLPAEIANNLVDSHSQCQQPIVTSREGNKGLPGELRARTGLQLLQIVACGHRHQPSTGAD